MKGTRHGCSGLRRKSLRFCFIPNRVRERIDKSERAKSWANLVRCKMKDGKGCCEFVINDDEASDCLPSYYGVPVET